MIWKKKDSFEVEFLFEFEAESERQKKALWKIVENNVAEIAVIKFRNHLKSNHQKHMLLFMKSHEIAQSIDKSVKNFLSDTSLVW